MQTTIPIKEAETRFSELLESARKYPINVTRNGEVIAVLLPPEDYRKYRRLEEERLATTSGQDMFSPEEIEGRRRLRESFRKCQEQARRNGIDKLTLEEFDRLINED